MPNEGIAMMLQLVRYSSMLLYKKMKRVFVWTNSIGLAGKGLGKP